ncbi:MAG: hydrogenase expression/formation protein HypE [Propionibacteriaceae bacterium]|nr:hydrogenase expression/formation protein HypE [Propionibacteriaceae bacterium]
MESSAGDGLGHTRELILECASRFPGAMQYVGLDSVAVTTQSQRFAVTVDSFTVSPLFFPGGDLGKLAVCGSINDLACSGARMTTMLWTMVLGPHLTHDDFIAVCDSAAREAAHSGIQLTGGDTKFVDVDDPRFELLIAVTGIGELRSDGLLPRLESAQPGDEIIVVGSLGDHAIAVLSAREGLGFDRIITSDCRALFPVANELIEEFGEGIVGLRDLTRGGLLAAAVDLASLSGADVVLLEAQLPISVHVRAATDMLGLDPIELANEGALMVVVRGGRARQVLFTLARLGEPATLVGQCERSGAGGVVYLQSAEGLRTQQGEPWSLGVPRLC